MRQKGQICYNHLPVGINGWEVMRIQPKKKIPKNLYVTQAESKPADMHIMDSNVISFERLE